MNKAIGGYFEFDIKNKNKYPYQNGYQFKSARSAFYSFLLELKIKEIYFPRYICNSMIKPLELLGINIKWYSLNESFAPIIDDYNNEHIVYVNYFGICDLMVDKLSINYPLNKLIIDNSQSLFSSPNENCAATLYSPRKFIPVPEGGTIITQEKLNYSGQSYSSINAIYALVRRLELNASSGYQYFRDASEELNNISCDRMSEFSSLILNNIDYKSYEESRLDNFLYLHSKLSCFNLINININSSPLCYPLKLDVEVSNIKSELIKNKIYVATYWLDAIDRISIESIEFELIHNTLFLPLDHRYNRCDMDAIISILLEEMDV